MEILREKLKLLPDEPGVYIMLDQEGVVIYVGKAKILKNRVRQYFHNDEKPEKVAAMVSNIADFRYIITKSEIDALALENNLIKKYKPKYNILLKDDKTYPYIRVHTNEEFPRVSITRRIEKQGKYFGPFMGGISCKELLEVIALVYQVRLCSTAITAKPKKPCLNYHLKRCLAPCAHLVTKEEYALRVQKVLSFLDGNYEEAEEALKKRMLTFAENEEFELAIQAKNQLEMLSKLKLRRITAINRNINADVIAFESNGLYSAINILLTRKGIMQGGSNYAEEEGSLTKEEALTSFIVQYYSHHEIPHEIILDETGEKSLLEEFFLTTFHKKVEVVFAKQGVRKKLLEMAHRNAAEYLEKSIDKIRHKSDMTVDACKRLKELLSLSQYPKRMECYDISNISGVDKVGSMVVFVDGEPEKTSYRRFKIKTVEGANDFASLQEVLSRRLSKLGTDEEERFSKPQLIVIDGGKGQLSAVKEIFEEKNITGIDLVSLAKEEEEVFTLNRADSVRIDHRDYALKLLQRLRDEAHRFAITYFRSLHSKKSLQSILTEIEGVGEKKRAALMEKFHSLDAVLSASQEEIASVEGIGSSLAKRIQQYLAEKL